MASRFAISHSLQLLGLSSASHLTCVLSPLQAARFIGASSFRSWPDVIVPPMGESIKEGSIAAVLKQVGQPVREDEVIAQIETDKVTIDIKSPTAGVLQQLHVKPLDAVVAGQVVAVVGATDSATLAGAAPAASKFDAVAASSAGLSGTIHFPPRFTASGTRISDLPESEYAAAVAAAKAAVSPSSPSVAITSEMPVIAPLAPKYPLPAAKAAPPPFAKNKLQYITRPDGRGGPPRRPLNERELEMINLGGVY